MTRRWLGANVVDVPLHDFSGGFTPRLAATEFTERQWAEIKGFVLESTAVLRSQWSAQKIGVHTGLVEIATLGRRIVGVDGDGRVWTTLSPLSWMTADDCRTLVDWEEITEVTPRETLRPLCTIPVPHEDSEGFTYGILFNDGDASGSAYAVYLKPGSHDYAVKEWSDRFPEGGVTDGVMPPARVAEMWGDYLVLGDIEWVDDPDEDLSAANSKRFEHALWFAEPDAVDKFDPLGVVFTQVGGHGSSRPSVLDIVPVDAGLLVFTVSGLFLLRGQPGDFDVEPIRWGIATREPRSVAYWPYVGAVVWVDNAGQVWQTNGERFERADVHLHMTRDMGEHDNVGVLGEYAVVERDGEALVFTAFDEEGAWTQLVPPNGSMRSMTPIGDQLYFLDDDGQCWRWNRRGELFHADPSNGGWFQDGEAPGERGLVDGDPVELRVSTRTLETGSGQSVTFWHRFGFRAEGPGKVLSADIVAGPALSDAPRTTHTLQEAAGERERVVLRAHGPSPEAAAVVRCEGDVKLEQFAFWVHEGRGDR